MPRSIRKANHASPTNSRSAKGNKHVTPELDLFSDEGLAFVQAQGLDVYEAELGPGDTLLLPGNHPHQVKNLDNNIMLTSNYIAPQDLPYSLSTIASEYAKPLLNVLSQMAAALQEPSGSRYLTDPEFLNHQKKIFGNLLLKYNNLYTTVKTLASRHEESLQK